MRVTLIHPRLEYTAPARFPNRTKEIRETERIQRAATKMVKSLKDLPYEKRLERMELLTLYERRRRRDMLAVFLAMKGNRRS